MALMKIELIGPFIEQTSKDKPKECVVAPGQSTIQIIDSSICSGKIGAPSYNGTEIPQEGPCDPTTDTTERCKKKSHARCKDTHSDKQTQKRNSENVSNGSDK